MSRAVSLELESAWVSTCSWRVRLGLHAKGLPFTYTAVDIESPKPGRSSGASGKVPQLTVRSIVAASDSTPDRRILNAAPAVQRRLEEKPDQPLVIGESLAILNFLDDAFPASRPRLFPADPFTAAKVREALQIVTAEGQPLQNLKVRRELQAVLESTGLTPDQSLSRVFDWSKKWTVASLVILERLASENSDGRFLVADAGFSAADCGLIPHAFTARKRYGIDLKEFPMLHRVYEWQSSDATFGQVLRKSHSMSQPDAKKV